MSIIHRWRKYEEGLQDHHENKEVIAQVSLIAKAHSATIEPPTKIGHLEVGTLPNDLYNLMSPKP